MYMRIDLKIGYARTSTIDQRYSLEDQIQKLKASGCEKVFSEQISSVEKKRPEFEAAFEFAREGDVFVVTTMSRLARSITDLWEALETLKRKGVSLLILDLGIDTGTATGTLLLSLLASVSQFEREILLERQKVGIARAKSEGKFKGRAPTARKKMAAIQKLHAQGIPSSEIARTLKISVPSVYRYRNSCD